MLQFCLCTKFLRVKTLKMFMIKIHWKFVQSSSSHHYIALVSQFDQCRLLSQYADDKS